MNEKGLKVTENANEFTATAKIAVAEKVDGVWTVNDAQASRYSKVCIFLDANDVSDNAAAAFLDGKTMTSIIRPTNKGDGDKTEAEMRFLLGLTALEEEFGAGDIISWKSDKFYVSDKSGLRPGPNLAVVVIGEDYEVQSIARLAGMARR